MPGMDVPPARRRIHIDLDLELTGDEVEGRAAAPGLEPRSFSGWVGLIAALDGLVGDEPVGPGSGPAEVSGRGA